MSSARKVLSNTVFQIFGNVLIAALSIITLKLISTYLGKEGYGQYSTIYQYLMLFGVLADFGIFQLAVKEMSAHPENRPKIFGNIFALRSVLVLIAMTVAVIIGFLIPKYTGTKIPLGILIASITTLLTLLSGTLATLLQIALKMQWNAISLVVGKIATLSYILAVIYYWLPRDPMDGFYQLLVAGIFGGLVGLLINFLSAKKIGKISFQLDLTFWKTIGIKALPYGTAILLATIYSNIDIILLSLMKTSEEVGVYSVPARILSNLTTISIFFLNCTLPIMTRLFHDNQDKLRRLLQYSFDFLVLTGLPMIVGGILLAAPLTSAISSPDFVSDMTRGFYGSDIALKILLVGMLFSFFANLFNYTLLAGNKQLKILYINLAAVLFNVLTNLRVIPFWGFRGAAVVSAITQLLVCCLGFYYVRKLTHVRFHLKVSLKALTAALIMGASLIYLKNPLTQILGANKSLFVLILIGMLVYGVILLATNAITKETLELVRKKD